MVDGAATGAPVVVGPTVVVRATVVDVVVELRTGTAVVVAPEVVSATLVAAPVLELDPLHAASTPARATAVSRRPMVPTIRSGR
jgi:hypothetical protein